MLTIKKHKNKNQYLLVKDGWVRDFAKISSPIDINRLFTKEEYKDFIGNENVNMTINLPSIDGESIRADSVVIVSDGYDFNDCVKLLEGLSKRSIIIAVNGALNNWKQGMKFHYYLTNNPYVESMDCLPKHSYLPFCIASNRTHPEFIRRYTLRGGVVYRYTPTPQVGMCNSAYKPLFYVDDYRNPICAAIGLACRWHVNKLILVSPHDLVKENRPSTEKIDNGLYIYPQQMVAHNFIDGCLYWLNQFNGCQIAHVGSGPAFKNAIRLDQSSAQIF